MKTVCLFCASLDGNDPFFSKNAREFGEILAKKQYSFLYGGGSLGLMGIAAKSALKHKVKVISIIHAGWKGAYIGIIKKVIKFLINNGSNVRDLI